MISGGAGWGQRLEFVFKVNGLTPRSAATLARESIQQYHTGMKETAFITDRQIYDRVILETIPETKEFLWLATSDLKIFT